MDLASLSVEQVADLSLEQVQKAISLRQADGKTFVHFPRSAVGRALRERDVELTATDSPPKAPTPAEIQATVEAASPAPLPAQPRHQSAEENGMYRAILAAQIVCSYIQLNGVSNTRHFESMAKDMSPYMEAFDALMGSEHTITLSKTRIRELEAEIKELQRELGKARTAAAKAIKDRDETADANRRLMTGSLA